MDIYYAYKAIKIAKVELGKNHPDLATSYGDAAYAYKQISKYEEAKKYANYYLEISRLAFGENSPSTVNTHQLLTWIDNEIETAAGNVRSLKDIPPELKTQEHCLEAICKTPSSMDFIPEEFKTEEFCLASVEINPQTFRYLCPEQRTLAVCRAALKQDGYLGLQYTPNELKTIYAWKPLRPTAKR